MRCWIAALLIPLAIGCRENERPQTARASATTPRTTGADSSRRGDTFAPGDTVRRMTEADTSRTPLSAEEDPPCFASRLGLPCSS
jgi:hypothetical protein